MKLEFESIPYAAIYGKKEHGQDKRSEAFYKELICCADTETRVMAA